MGLTQETLRDHLGIDYEDPSTFRILSRLVTVADKYMIGALGENYPAEDERVIQAQLMICDDLFSSRGVSDKVSGKKDADLIDGKRICECIFGGLLSAFLNKAIVDISLNVPVCCVCRVADNGFEHIKVVFEIIKVYFSPGSHSDFFQ